MDIRVTPNTELNGAIRQLATTIRNVADVFPEFKIPKPFQDQIQEVGALVDSALNVNAKERVRREQIFFRATEMHKTIGLRLEEEAVKISSALLLQKLKALRVHQSLVEEHEELGKYISSIPVIVKRKSMDLQHAGQQYYQLEERFNELVLRNVAITDQLMAAEFLKGLPAVRERLRVLALRVESDFLPRTWTLDKQMDAFRDLATVGNGRSGEAVALYQKIAVSLEKLAIDQAARELVRKAVSNSARTRALLSPRQ